MESVGLSTVTQPVQDPADLLKRLAALPPFPSTARRLLSISTDSDTAIEEYEDAFKSDPALAAELLRGANSIEFGLVGRVDNIRQALTLLGLDRVNSLAVTLAMRQYAAGAPRHKIIQPLWAHGIASAVIAEALASVRGYPPTGLYTAGLVHDVGRLGLLMATTESRYAKFLAQPVAGRAEAAALEREQFGVTHGEVGAIMAQAWGFPAWLCDVIRYHDNPGEDRPVEERFRLAQIACLAANAFGHGEHGDPPGVDARRLEPALPADLRGRTALEPEHLRQRGAKLLFTLKRPRG